jgi:rhodanese-related sulfurtransferase
MTDTITHQGSGNDAPADILARAAQRAVQMNLAYGGAVTPREAWQLLSTGTARLVDVRTEPEWTFVGRIPDVPLVEWRAYKADGPNAQFLEQLREHVPPGVPVMFLCRSGVRSDSAAKLAAANGWPMALNILEGFEGDLDKQSGQRGTLGGWRRAGLPWVQG